MKKNTISTFILGILACLGCVGCFGPDGISVYKGEQRLHRTVSIDDIERIDVYVKHGEVTIGGCDGAEIEIKAKVTARASFEHRAKEMASLARLSVEKGPKSIKISPVLPSLFDPRCFQVELNVQIPWKKLAATKPATQPTNLPMVNVRTQTGSLAVGNLQSQLNAVSEAGNIEVRESAGVYRLRTDTGSIELENTYGTLVAKTETGKINILHCAGVIDASSDTATVTFTAENGTWTGQGVKGDTRTGKVKIIPPSAKKKNFSFGNLITNP